jgi:hypothetical protein
MGRISLGCNATLDRARCYDKLRADAISHLVLQHKIASPTAQRNIHDSPLGDRTHGAGIQETVANETIMM